MVVKEVEMSAGKACDFGERVIHDLRVERATSREESILVTESTMMRAAARDDNRIRNQIPLPLNKIAPYGWQAFQSSNARLVAAPWCSCPQVLQELRKRVLSGADKDRVCVWR